MRRSYVGLAAGSDGYEAAPGAAVRQPYVPALLGDRDPVLDDAVKAEAQAASDMLESVAQRSADVTGLGWVCARSEAVASSLIENVTSRVLDVAAVEAAATLPEAPDAVSAAACAAATLDAVTPERGGELAPMDKGWLLRLHDRLMGARGERRQRIAGKYRTGQVIIGGGSIATARFVPPPQELVHELMDDLLAWCSEPRLSPVAQAAIAHAQFETIHPFADGNGRVGRALIAAILARRVPALVAASEPLVPTVSVHLNDVRRNYYDSLKEYDSEIDAATGGQHIDCSQMVRLLAWACSAAAENMGATAMRLRNATDVFKTNLTLQDASADAMLLLEVVPRLGMFSLVGVAGACGMSVSRARDALGYLLEAEAVRVQADHWFMWAWREGADWDKWMAEWVEEIGDEELRRVAKSEPPMSTRQKERERRRIAADNKPWQDQQWNG